MPSGKSTGVPFPALYAANATDKHRRAQPVITPDNALQDRAKAERYSPTTEDKVSKQLKNTKSSIARQGFKEALGLLKEASACFPPLQSALSGLLHVVKLYDVCATSKLK
jgi:hypothetical protein